MSLSRHEGAGAFGAGFFGAGAGFFLTGAEERLLLTGAEVRLLFTGAEVRLLLVEVGVVVLLRRRWELDELELVVRRRFLVVDLFCGGV